MTTTDLAWADECDCANRSRKLSSNPHRFRNLYT